MINRNNKKRNMTTQMIFKSWSIKPFMKIKINLIRPRNKGSQSVVVMIKNKNKEKSREISINRTI